MKYINRLWFPSTTNYAGIKSHEILIYPTWMNLMGVMRVGKKGRYKRAHTV